MTITSGALPATVNHELHQEHKLSLVDMASWSFNCDVCKQHGEGTAHYRCEPCNFHAHPECATAPATFKHVNYAGDFVLYAESGSGDPPMCCGLCGLEVLGYRYYNREEYDRLHPSCAFMPRRVIQDGRTFQLGYHPSGTCAMCKNPSTTSLSYRSTYDDGEEVYLHVQCLVDTNNRLTGYQDWVASAPIMPGVLRSFTRKKQGGGLMKAASLSFDIARAVLEVASLDIGGMAETAQTVAEAFNSE
ncbi:hypothetical protein CFC21_084937 [Triticum aestivum]|uniref:DC1 domain-containing protein n=2 Tax=Triticum aestivum TaxID=4565 RepID=A0A9R1ICS8_WHEAT|nr:uncharacterized protein LOC119314429 [Triticum dicoccoides]XP_044406832.1 uncharacterized protein LOC123131162 [Triticum aestivum]KAF7080942.1 hypothetical protein CFC21_084937 [Triticum aestivum]